MVVVGGGLIFGPRADFFGLVGKSVIVKLRVKKKRKRLSAHSMTYQ